MLKICVLTPDPDYFDDAASARILLEQSIDFIPDYRIWTSIVCTSELQDYNLVLPLFAWGYHEKSNAWFALLNKLEAANIALANPVNLLRWNSHKSYLLELATYNIPIVPTIIAPLTKSILSDAREKFSSDILIVKPPISGGSEATYKLEYTDDEMICSAHQNADMMIQPYLSNIATIGEYSLLYFGGQYSHAILKRPKQGDFRVQYIFGGSEKSITPTLQMQMIAEKTIAHLPSKPLYARIDLVSGNDGQLKLMEIECIEPSLFLKFGGGSAFSHAIQNYNI